MKAETILKLIERAREPMLKEAHLKAYAEAMIKKDRERVKGNYPPCKDFTVNAISESIVRCINDTPIILD